MLHQTHVHPLGAETNAKDALGKAEWPPGKLVCSTMSKWKTCQRITQVLHPLWLGIAWQTKACKQARLEVHFILGMLAWTMCARDSP